MAVARTGLVEVEPPPRYGPRGGFSTGQVLAIARQLSRDVWVSDKLAYQSRSGANYRAEVLIERLIEHNIDCERRTWKDKQNGWRWAIRRRLRSNGRGAPPGKRG